jgi:Bacterial Ig-like domain (group 3)
MYRQRRESEAREKIDFVEDQWKGTTMFSALLHFLRDLCSFDHRPARRRPTCKPALESLEDRAVPALTAGVGTNIAPQASVVSLVVKYNDIGQVRTLTGAFIDQAHILTAADQFYNPNSSDNGHFPDQVDVLAGRNGSYASADGQVYHASRVDLMPGYLAHVGQFGASDLAVLTVNPIPSHGNFSWANNADQVGYGPLTIYSAGYPNDSYFGPDGATPYWTVGQVSGVDTQTAPDGTPLLTWHNTPRDGGIGLSLYMAGQEGSPLYWFDSNNRPGIVGVEIGGNLFTGSDGLLHVNPNGNGFATALTGYASSWVQSILNGGNSGAGTHSIPVPPSKTNTITNLFTTETTTQVGHWVTFRATVSAPNSVTAPTGTVTFYDNFTFLGQYTLLPVGPGIATTSLSTSTLSPGTHIISAVYSGDGSHTGSTSLSLHETVVPPQPASAPHAGSPGVRVVRVGGRQLVVVYNRATGAVRFRLLPFGYSFRGRLTATLKDVDGDGTLDLLVTAVVKGRRVRRAFNTSNGALL